MLSPLSPLSLSQTYGITEFLWPVEGRATVEELVGQSSLGLSIYVHHKDIDKDLCFFSSPPPFFFCAKMVLKNWSIRMRSIGLVLPPLFATIQAEKFSPSKSRKCFSRSFSCAQSSSLFRGGDEDAWNNSDFSHSLNLFIFLFHFRGKEKRRRGCQPRSSLLCT